MFLGGEVQFGKSGRLLAVTWGGRALGSPERNRLKELIDANQAWSDQQISTLLRDKGAKFGPGDKAALMAHVRKMGLERVFGRYKIGRIRFEFRNLESQGTTATTAVLWWEVRIETNTAHQMLHFEPFEGRLVGAGGFEKWEVPPGVKVPK